MSSVPVQVIVAAFATPDGAGNVMAALTQAKKEWLIGIQDMAIVVKDADGKLKITNSKHRSTRGFITGGVIGALIGLLAGPVGLVALAGGAIGALAGKLRGAPLKAEMLDLGTALVPNSSAIVALIEHIWVAEMEAALAAEGARVVHDELKADIAAQLNAGGNVVYSAVESDNGAAVTRTAGSADKASAGAVVATADAVLVENATLTSEKLPEPQTTA